MTDLLEHNFHEFNSITVALITDFFISKLKAVKCDFNDRPSEGMIHVHFLNLTLQQPLSFCLPENRISEVLEAQETLLPKEPFRPTIKIEYYQPPGSTNKNQLDFLKSNLPLRDTNNLCTRNESQLPIYILRKKLSEFAAQTERGMPLVDNYSDSMKATVERLIRDTIDRYYTIVDRGNNQDISEIVSMFSENGVYNRAGMILSGRKEIEEFYSKSRTLKGMHEITSIVTNKLFGHVTGIFKGRSNKKNEYRILEFSDTWQFDLNGFVSLRKTYLSEGHELTV